MSFLFYGDVTKKPQLEIGLSRAIADDNTSVTQVRRLRVVSDLLSQKSEKLGALVRDSQDTRELVYDEQILRNFKCPKRFVN